jgi:cellulose synthase operon protein C
MAERPGTGPSSLRQGRGARAWHRLIAGAFLLALVGCGSPEEKEARHLERGIAYYDEGNDAKALIEFRNVLRLNPKNVQAVYYAGRIHERAQRWSQAFAAYQAAVADKPDFIEAHVQLGKLALLAEELQLARTTGEAITRIDPDHPDGLAILGAVALRQGETQQALDLAKRALAHHPDHDNSIAVYAGVLQRTGEHERAVAFVDEAIQRRPQSAALRLLKIGLIEQTGDAERIRTAYDELVNFDPTNESYQLAFAQFLRNRDDISGAEAVLRRTVESDYGSAQSTRFLIDLIRKSRGFEAADAELRRQIERHPDEHVLRFMLAELNTQEGRFDAADSELRTVIERVGEGAVAQDALAARAQVALLRDDPALAKELAGQVVAQNAEHRGANFVRALVALRANEYDEVIRNARTALRRDPQWVPGLKLVAEAHYRKGERDLAIDALDDIVNLNPADVQAAEVLANLLTQRGDLDAAVKVWNLVLEQSEDKGRALQSRAQIAIRQQNWTAAQQDIDQLLTVADTQATGALLAGNLLTAQSRFDQGREWYRKAQDIAPDAPEPVIGVVRTYLAQDDLAGATAYLQQHTAAKPDDAIAFNLMGELAARRSDLDGAATAFQKAMSLQPSWATPRRQMAGALAQGGRVADAVTVLREATEMLPDNPELLNDYAGLLLAAGQPAEAIPVYERVLVLQPGSELAVNNLAALIADYRHADPAALNRALELAARFRTSNNPLFLDTLGWLYYRKGEHAVAATYLDRAVILAGDRPDLRYHLGMALANSGQKDRAIRELEQATAPQVVAYHGIEEARAMLEQLKRELAPKPTTAAGTSG